MASHPFLILAILLIAMLDRTVQETCTQGDYTVMFEDCSAFYRFDFFGGSVCTSNGKVYPNSLYVRCLNYHDSSLGINVNYRGNCTTVGQACPYSPFYDPVCGTNGRTYANLEALVCHVTMNSSAQVGVAHPGSCSTPKKKSCSAQWKWEEWGRNPVCGNNGLTYVNIAQVRCLKLHQSDLVVIHDGGCTLPEARKNAAQTRSAACNLAGERFEWNPVCGKDNSTYQNPFIALCKHPGLEVQFQGTCESPVHVSCRKASAIDRGDKLEDTHQVCGSNGLTYKSQYHLHCATLKDKYLWALHKGHCGVQDDPCLLRGWPHVDGAGQPVCGSDGKTYVSPAAIWCKHLNHDPCLHFLHDGECLSANLKAPLQEMAIQSFQSLPEYF